MKKKPGVYTEKDALLVVGEHAYADGLHKKQLAFRVSSIEAYEVEYDTEGLVDTLSIVLRSGHEMNLAKNDYDLDVVAEVLSKHFK